MTQDEFLRTDPGDRDSEKYVVVTLLRDEVRQQCAFICIGYTRLEARQSSDEFWFFVQGILNAAANVSKIFWDFEQHDADEERNMLRKGLGVDEKSPFRKRDVRNGFEHIDREVVKAVRNSGSADAFSFRTMPNNLFDGVQATHFGEVRQGETTVRFFDHEVDLVELRAEANRLLGLLNPAA